MVSEALIVNVTVMGGSTFVYPNATMRTAGEWLEIVSPQNEVIAAHATHRTVRVWYSGMEPKEIKAC
jgi:hypothetical protein